MAKEAKVLGTWASPFVMRPRIALNLKSVEYEFIEESLLNPKSELLLKSNPVHKKIPVFFHNDKTVIESLIIVQYIDEIFSGPSILPSHPYDRATHRFWAAYIDDKWFPSMLAAIGSAPTEEAKAAAEDQLKEGIALLEDAFGKISNGKPFFGGDKIGYLDIAFGCFLGWLRVTEKMTGVKLLDEAKTPSLAAWADNFCAYDAVKDVMPDTDELMEFAKVFFFKAKSSC